jgi:hypothetical protein
MEPYLQQVFDVLLRRSAEDLAERAIHRCGGLDQALAAMDSDPDGEGVWRTEFTSAVFAEQLLDSPSGAAFVLNSLARRELPADPGGPAAEVLDRLARAAFGDALLKLARQEVQRRMAFA